MALYVPIKLEDVLTAKFMLEQLAPIARTSGYDHDRIITKLAAYYAREVVYAQRMHKLLHATHPPLDMSGHIFLFARGDFVLHKKSGGVYFVDGLPDVNRIEATGEAAYRYQDAHGQFWHREWRQFEARFVKIEIKD